MAGQRQQRQQILVSAEHKRRVREMADELGCSVSEVYRRAADAYITRPDVEEIDNPELEALVESLEENIARASTSMERAEQQVRATLDFFETRAHMREIR